jgi:hypothetical protein
MSIKEAGIRSFRKRLVEAIRDRLLDSIDDPATASRDKTFAAGSIAGIGDLTKDQHESLKASVAMLVDAGIFQFLYGLDNDDNGFDIRFQGKRLNADGSYDLSDSSVPLADESRFDSKGKRRAK